MYCYAQTLLQAYCFQESDNSTPAVCTVFIYLFSTKLAGAASATLIICIICHAVSHQPFISFFEPYGTSAAAPFAMLGANYTPGSRQASPRASSSRPGSLGARGIITRTPSIIVRVVWLVIFLLLFRVFFPLYPSTTVTRFPVHSCWQKRRQISAHPFGSRARLAAVCDALKYVRTVATRSCAYCATVKGLTFSFGRIIDGSFSHWRIMDRETETNSMRYESVWREAKEG